MQTWYGVFPLKAPLSPHATHVVHEGFCPVEWFLGIIFEKDLKESQLRTSLVVLWIRMSVNAGDTGSIPGPGRFHMPRSNEAHAPQLLSPCA